MAEEQNKRIPSWFLGEVDSPVGKIPRVRTHWTTADKRGALKVRLHIRRMRYGVRPGLYAVGNPTDKSHVFVSANYKLSFDHLRRALEGIDAWIMVLDTKNINVWCAAGKGTFGTDEIIRRIEETRLKEVVSHRKLILPQLGAPGVAAHKVQKQTKFRVVYGPVRAADIPAFLEAGMEATPEMRHVRFDLKDRLVVVPVDVIGNFKHVFLLALALALLAGLHRSGFQARHIVAHGPRAGLLLLLAYLAGGILVPALLPWIPGRPFSMKGLVVGLAVFVGIWVSGCVPGSGIGALLEKAGWLLLVPAIASLMALNFTGTSTYTSLSGVRREMRVAVPLQIAALVMGSGLWLAARVVG